MKAGSKGLPSLMATAYGYLSGALASDMGTLDSDSRAALEALVSSIPQVSHMNAASSIKEMSDHAYRDGSIQPAS